MRRERDINKYMIISIVAVGILVISLIGAIIGRNSKKAKENSFASEMSSLNKKLEEAESASTKMGKSVEEAEEDEEEFETAELISNENNSKKEGTKTEKKVQEKKSTSEQKKSVASSVSTDKANNVKEKSEDEKSTTETNAEGVKENIEFEAPIKGEIIREFAKDSLVFSNTLQEWVTHNGIDIKADKTTVVKSAANGTVSAIKNDPRYGLTVIINHDNGYQTVYSNLLTAEFVVKGEKVEKGQTIGTVGNSAAFEVADVYHLHFELLRNNEYLDPVIYMNF